MTNAPTADFYHMSANALAVGAEIPGNGKDKVDPRIEAELEKRCPSGMFSRRDAVYARPISDFSRCGIVNSGYIYRVRLNGKTQRHDLSWIGPMQMALLKQKYAGQLSAGMKKYPDWTDELVERCCTNYWAAADSGDAVWECLAPSFTVLEALSDQPIPVAATKGGWPPASAS
ncbi:MAG TPA: hypothetical protein VJ846_01930 [Sphingomicrobium sp.]|nr:hypothetical protein [Sphingomicrobium sp.]